MSLSHNILIQVNYCTTQAAGFHYYCLYVQCEIHPIISNTTIIALTTVRLLSAPYVFPLLVLSASVVMFNIAARVWFYEA